MEYRLWRERVWSGEVAVWVRVEWGGCSVGEGGVVRLLLPAWRTRLSVFSHSPIACVRTLHSSLGLAIHVTVKEVKLPLLPLILPCTAVSCLLCLCNLLVRLVTQQC